MCLSQPVNTDFEGAVYVLHVFAKKTRKASSLDVELGKKRYR